MKKLQFADLDQRHFGVTSGVAAYYGEVTRVCLSRAGGSPTVFTIVDSQVGETSGEATWTAPSTRERAAHNNEIDATEAAAYCIALAATELTRAMVAISRAETLTGSDYYLGPVGSSADDLEDAKRLEVSGTDRGSSAQMVTRLRQKIDQAKRGRSAIPAIAAVVGFSERHIMIADV